MKRFLRLFLILAVAGTGFVWGYFTHRNRIFPYAWIRRTAAPAPRFEAAGASPQVRELLSLPYISAAKTTAPHLRGVVQFREEAFEGLNFYNSHHAAYLVDMNGTVRHRWKFPLPGIWTHAELLPDGVVLASLGDVGLFRLDRRGRILSRIDLPSHHDFTMHDGQIHALIHRQVRVPSIHPDVPVLADFIATVGADGKVVRERSLLEPLLRSPYAALLPRLQHRTLDPETREINLLHANHVEIADGSLRRFGPLYARGNVLVSFRNIHAAAILDGRTFDILWLWGPSNLTKPHHPTFLPNGRILIFNNGVSASEVLEVDPRTNEVHWRYWAGPEFFSESRGGSQRLPNGNTLITESDRGEVFEVTPRGKVVWRFLNPDVNEKSERTIIWRMRRLTRIE